MEEGRITGEEGMEARLSIHRRQGSRFDEHARSPSREYRRGFVSSSRVEAPSRDSKVSSAAWPTSRSRIIGWTAT